MEIRHGRPCLRGRHVDGPDLPAGAIGTEAEDAAAAVAARLQTDGYTLVGWEQNGVNVRPPAGGAEQYIGLANLYRRAKHAEPAEWPELIGSFLDRLAKAVAAPDIPHDLTTIADRLRPRLGRPFDRTAAHPWGIPLPEIGRAHV